MTHVTRSSFLPRIAALLAILLFSVVSFAQSDQQIKFKKLNIKNFGQMDDRFFRGGQPKEGDYKDLAALGVKTVIDLRVDSKEYEKRTVESLGMRYVNIPMEEKKYPTEDQVQQFLKVVDDPGTGKFFVHCAGGRHRTGVMGAVYRFTHYGWNYDQVYKEMEHYDFYTSWGHGDYKKFVQDYWQRVQASGNRTSAGVATSF
jgi:protein tyrosine phosphatase (PTP) superfamily phosphohydrolase (DUF442 family)